MTYTVKEIAEMMELTKHTIRFYTDKGLMPCGRDKNNRRVFDDESINWLTGIKCLKKCGVSIEDIKSYSDLCIEGDSALEARYQFMLKQRVLAYQRMQEAKEVVEYMERKVKHYEDILNGIASDDTNPQTRSADTLPHC